MGSETPVDRVRRFVAARPSRTPIPTIIHQCAHMSRHVNIYTYGSSASPCRERSCGEKICSAICRGVTGRRPGHRPKSLRRNGLEIFARKRAFRRFRGEPGKIFRWFSLYFQADGRPPRQLVTSRQAEVARLRGTLLAGPLAVAASRYPCQLAWQVNKIEADFQPCRCLQRH